MPDLISPPRTPIRWHPAPPSNPASAGMTKPDMFNWRSDKMPTKGQFIPQQRSLRQSPPLDGHHMVIYE